MSVKPTRAEPAYTQRRDSEARAAAVGYIPADAFAALATFPVAIGAGASLALETIYGAGFNSGMIIGQCTGFNLTVTVTHISPASGITTQLTRTIGTLTAGGGVGVINFGVGTSGLSFGAADVWLQWFLTITNAGGVGASLDAWAGIWLQAR